MWHAIQATYIVQEFVYHALEEPALVVQWAITNQVQTTVWLAEQIVRHALLISALTVLMGTIISYRIAMNALGAFNPVTISPLSIACVRRLVKTTARCVPLPQNALCVKRAFI